MLKTLLSMAVRWISTAEIRAKITAEILRVETLRAPNGRPLAPGEKFSAVKAAALDWLHGQTANLVNLLIEALVYLAKSKAKG